MSQKRNDGYLEKLYKEPLVGKNVKVLSCQSPEYVGKCGRVLAHTSKSVKVHFSERSARLPSRHLLLEYRQDSHSFLIKMEEFLDLKRRLSKQSKNVNFFV